MTSKAAGTRDSGAPARLAAVLRAAAPADGVLLSDLADIRWTTGFTGSNALVLVLDGRARLFTDARYQTQAAAEVSGAEVEILSGSLLPSVAEKWLGNVSRLAVQSDRMPMADAEALRARAPGVDLVPIAGLVSALRARKTTAEVQAIRAAQELTESVFAEILDVIREGVTEREVAAEITYRHLRAGASAMSFDPIVAFGSNAALPHGRPTSRRLRRGDPVLIDMGCFLNGYASDMTRMLSFGAPSEDFRTVHGVVRDALHAARDAARSGMAASDLDRVARDRIEAAGFGPQFGHSLGHGVGLEIHEAPSVSFRSDSPLPEHAVVTLEPGIYLPDRFGVRIEDIVHLLPDGCTRITELDTNLTIL